MKRLIFFLFLLLLPIALLAQSETPEFDPGLVNKILITGIGGLGVAALTEMLKRLVGAQGTAAYVISGIVSAAATAFVLATSGMFTILAFKPLAYFAPSPLTFNHLQTGIEPIPAWTSTLRS